MVLDNDAILCLCEENVGFIRWSTDFSYGFRVFMCWHSTSMVHLMCYIEGPVGGDLVLGDELVLAMAGRQIDVPCIRSC